LGGYLVINLALKTKTQSNIAPNWWTMAISHGAAYITVVIPKIVCKKVTAKTKLKQNFKLLFADFLTLSQV
jgi:hypothetical protein